MALDQIGQLEQHRLSLERLYLAPRAVEGPTRRLDGAVDILRVSFRHSGKDFAGCRIDAVERLPRRRLDPLAVDQHALRRPVEKRMACALNLLNHVHDIYPCGA